MSKLTPKSLSYLGSLASFYSKMSKQPDQALGAGKSKSNKKQRRPETTITTNGETPIPGPKQQAKRRQSKVAKVAIRPAAADTAWSSDDVGEETAAFEQQTLNKSQVKDKTNPKLRPKSKARIASKQQHQQASSTKRVKSRAASKSATTSRSKNVKSSGHPASIGVTKGASAPVEPKSIAGKQQRQPKSKERMLSKEKSKGSHCHIKKSTIKTGKPRAKSQAQTTKRPNAVKAPQGNTDNLTIPAKDNQATTAQALDLLNLLYQKIHQEITSKSNMKAADIEMKSKAAPIAEKQQKKDPSFALPTPAVDDPLVSEQRKLEELYDELYDLINKVKTLKDSYQKIIQSLVDLQQRRPKETNTLAPAPQQLPIAAGVAQGKQQPQKLPRASAQVSASLLDRFMDPATREESFRQLFAAIDNLQTRMATFKQCFDENGYIDMEEYGKVPIRMSDRDAWLGQLRSLNATVTTILRKYSDELLDMFRISESSISSPK